MKKKEPTWIEERETLAIHELLLAAHGGAAGVRDPGLLDSALARPHQHFSYATAWDVFDLAAIYTAGIVRNHRTGFVIGILFLELNGFSFRATEEDATQAVFNLTEGKPDEASYAAWLRTVSKRRK